MSSFVKKHISPLNRFFEFIYNIRFLIGIALIVVLTLFKVNGSSIGFYNNVFGEEDKNVIFGVSREIRSDEWATFTPIIFSQSYGEAPFSLINNIVRGEDTDVFIVYAAPVKDFFGMVFRPFLNGFIYLGQERGLAFFWSARLVCLWLITFELFIRLTDKKKLISAAGATALSFSPVIQWWFAINGLVEMFIFGSLIIVLTDIFLKTSRKFVKFLCLVGIYVGAGGYALTFYPADMIPLAYVYLALFIWVLIRNKSGIKKLKGSDVFSIVLTIALIGASLGYVLYRSWDTVTALMNTEYPGKRVSLGGECLDRFFSQWANLFFPFKGEGLQLNRCELAVMIDLFPLGIILSLFAMIKRKKWDALTIILWAEYLLISYYVIWKVPELFAKMTFLGKSSSGRAMVAIGFINLILLIKSLAEAEFNTNQFASLCLSGAYCALAVITSRHIYPEYMTVLFLIITGVLAFAFCYFALRIKNSYNFFCVLLIVVCLIAGATVNPIRIGIGKIYDLEVSKHIREIVNEDPDALWVGEGVEPGVSNFIILNGGRCISSTSVYPAEKWTKIDTLDWHKPVYNRYAHYCFTMEQADFNGEVFDLPYPDQALIHSTAESLEKLGVKYILTVNRLEQYSDSSYSFELLEESGEYKIYRFQNNS